MKFTRGLIDSLTALCSGETVPHSRLRGGAADQLLAEGLITVKANGSRRSCSAINPAALRKYLQARHPEVFATDTSRAEQARETGDSKLVAVRSCPGFPVNVFSPVNCRLQGRDFVIEPSPGSFVFIADWQRFEIPDDAIVVGVENMENFRLISRQKEFIERCLAQSGAVVPEAMPPVVFVSRYPQSTDLRRWLLGVPNRYFHFGDFDLAGIHIFQTEIQQWIGHRAAYLIPADIDDRIANGSTRRYNDQYARFRHIASADPTLQRLIDTINRHGRAYDQEGYIP